MWNEDVIEETQANYIIEKNSHTCTTLYEGSVDVSYTHTHIIMHVHIHSHMHKQTSDSI